MFPKMVLNISCSEKIFKIKNSLERNILSFLKSRWSLNFALSLLKGQGLDSIFSYVGVKVGQGVAYPSPSFERAGGRP